MTNDGRWKYTWDAENRLIQMETTSAATLAGHPYTKVKAVYDAQGRRIARTIWQGGTAAVPTFKSNHRYHYDGWNVISEYTSPSDPLVPRDPQDPPVPPVLSQTLTWGLDLSNTPQGAGGVGGLLSLSLLSSVSESSVFYPSYDGNGNITAWSQKTSTAPTARREYDAFGNTLVSEGIWPSSYGFSTKPQDAETGLYYDGYRYYDPMTGRWPSRDPIQEEGGVNLYGFVGNNSINNRDYLGQAIETPWDVFNVGVGFISFGANVASGNVVGALVDVGGITYDVVATAVSGLPAGASSGIKAYRLGKMTIRGTFNLAKAMRGKLAGANARILVRYAVGKLDEAHHMIPKGGPPYKFGSKLWEDIECIRTAAKKAGINLDSATNGVSIRETYHRRTGGVGGNTNTLQRWYYDEVVKRFKGMKKKEEFIAGLDEFAEWLLKQSEK